VSLQQKNITLLLGFILLLWLGYQFSFFKTFQLKTQYKTLLKEQALFTNVSQKLTTLKQQNIYYDSILKSKRISSESSFQNSLLQSITAFADTTNIKIVTFHNPHIYKADNVVFNTFSFKVNGSFSKITQLIYELEEHYKLGKIISVNFEKKKNYRHNIHFLECTILLQRIESS